ncbi:hypothetical protein DL96DRAFT_92779 [Flagelloscypha sp. PMI_526]|nr:hypothetical protein DL96DRAFT_92779 [Flagelloscypha sp. PMI_526]
MVSALWSACAEGNLPYVLELLNDPTQVNLEVKDEAGNTPLIQAVKNDHVEIVKALLEKGANPTNGSSEGVPAQLTTNPAILELFNFPQSTPAVPLNEAPNDAANGYAQPNGDAKAVYYAPPPPGAYPYFHAGQPGPDGASFYAPYPIPPPQPNGDVPPSGGPGNLPPPDIARFIPCRYYPACRYGASCMFLHPQGPYMPGPVPPPPGTYQFDPNMPIPQPFPPNMYAPLPPPNTHVPLADGQPQPHFLPPPNTTQPVQYNPTSPVSPSAYPTLSMPVPGGMPPQPHMNGGPQASPTVPFAYPPRQDAPYPLAAVNSVPAPGTYPVLDGQKPLVNGEVSELRQGPPHGHVRRASARRPSFGKPPCMFFPMGKCKNGNDCRFPHILPDTGPGSRGPGSRPPRPGSMDGFTGKFGGMHINNNSRSTNGFNPRGGKMNGARSDRKPPAAIRQKLPSADDFPVLASSITPPLRSPSLNGHVGLNGPTAAQVLQAPPPRKEPPSTRGPSPDSVEKNTPETPPQEPIELQENGSPATSIASKKLPLSFAAAAAAPEVVKEQVAIA